MPVLLAPIDAIESMRGVEEVVKEHAAIIAEIDGEIVGSLGLLSVRWWYAAEARFLTDRWFFCFPAVRNLGVGVLMLAEASALGTKTNQDVVINGHMRRRLAHVGRGVYFTHPVVIAPGEDPDLKKIEDQTLWSGDTAP